MSLADLIQLERAHAAEWADATVRPLRNACHRWDLRDHDPTRRTATARVVDWYTRMDWPRCFCAAAAQIITFEHLRHLASQARARRRVQT